MIYTISLWLLPVLIAITFHEAAHAFVARSLGDETASRLGRVSLNPLKHIDLIGTILLPGLLLLARSPFLFGYAKPVPVNFGALGNPRRDMVLVAAAGPAMNIGLAHCCGVEFPPCQLIASQSCSMGRPESKERSHHQRRLSSVQYVSPAAAGWWAYCRGLASRCSRHAARSVGALWYGNSDRSTYRPPGAGFTNRSGPQHRVSSDFRCD